MPRNHDFETMRANLRVWLRGSLPYWVSDWPPTTEEPLHRDNTDRQLEAPELVQVASKAMSVRLYYREPNEVVVIRFAFDHVRNDDFMRMKRQLEDLIRQNNGRATFIEAFAFEVIDEPYWLRSVREESNPGRPRQILFDYDFAWEDEPDE